jgi:ribosomal protein S18 acetylase RimI-like enzyme
LLEQLIGWARERGSPHLSLLVFPHNERALALYRKFDFVEIDAQAAQIARRSGEAWDAILMRKTLA